jgi:hypothetical protein
MMRRADSYARVADLPLRDHAAREQAAQREPKS